MLAKMMQTLFSENLSLLSIFATLINVHLDSLSVEKIRIRLSHDEPASSFSFWGSFKTDTVY